MTPIIILSYLAFVVGMLLIRSIVMQHRIKYYENKIFEALASRKKTLEEDMASLLVEANTIKIR